MGLARRRALLQCCCRVAPCTLGKDAPLATCSLRSRAAVHAHQSCASTAAGHHHKASPATAAMSSSASHGWPICHRAMPGMRSVTRMLSRYGRRGMPQAWRLTTRRAVSTEAHLPGRGGSLAAKPHSWRVLSSTRRRDSLPAANTPGYVRFPFSKHDLMPARSDSM
jgi:hypothetical protein